MALWKDGEEIVAEMNKICEWNRSIFQMKEEIATVGAFIRDRYRVRHPELASLVVHPLDLARLVRRVGNETDLSCVDLCGLLPSATIMVVSITASATTGQPLSDQTLAETLQACDRALALELAKENLLCFLQTCMGLIAPNLAAVVGPAVASQLMGTAGGLSELAQIPACNVQMLGLEEERSDLAGMSVARTLCVGYLCQTDLYRSTPPLLRRKVLSVLAAKSALAARMDSAGGDPTGKTGRGLREVIEKKIQKWQEPPWAKRPKLLPRPVSEPKKRLGGRRWRKTKARYCMSFLRKHENRMPFGGQEESLHFC